VSVDELAIFAVVLDAGADAAPEAFGRLRVVAVVLRADGREVDEAAVHGVLRREDVVEKGAFIIGGVARIGIAAVQLFGQPEHIVGVACFGSFTRFDHRGEILGGVEVFAHAVATEGGAAVVDDGGPEIARGIRPGGITAEFGNAGVADDFRDLRVGVESGEVVFVLEQWFECAAVGEALGEREIFGVASDGVYVGEDLIHAALFALEHALDLFVGEVGDEAVAPIAEPNEDVAGLGVAGDEPGVAEAGEGFMQVVPRDPFPVDGEVVHFQFAGGDFGPEFAAVGRAADVAVAVGALALGHLGDHVIEAARHLGVAGGDGHLGECGQVVAGHVAIEAGAFPVRVFRSFGGKACFGSEGGHEPVNIEREDVAGIDILRGLERSLGQAHIAQVEELDLGGWFAGVREGYCGGEKSEREELGDPGKRGHRAGN